MTRLIAPLAIAVATAGADMGTRLLEGQNMGIASAVTIAAFVGTSCLWLDKQFRVRDERRAERDANIGERLARIEQQLDDLPCVDHACDSEKKRK